MNKDEGVQAADRPEKVARFQGATVSSITAHVNDVGLGFNDVDMGIDIEGAVELRAGGRSARFEPGDTIALGKALMDVLGHRVASIKAAPDALSLTFDGEFEVIVRADASGDEAYVMFLPDGSSLVG